MSSGRARAMTRTKPASPHPNGKVERSHLIDKQELYQLLSYTGDRNLKRQLAEWEAFYNYHRPHTAKHQTLATNGPDPAKTARVRTSLAFFIR